MGKNRRIPIEKNVDLLITKNGAKKNLGNFAIKPQFFFFLKVHSVTVPYWSLKLFTMTL